MNHANFENSAIVLDRVDLAVIKPRARVQGAFRVFLLRYDSDGIQRKTFPNDSPIFIFCLVPVLLRTLLAGINDGMHFPIREIGFKCRLSRICLNW